MDHILFIVQSECLEIALYAPKEIVNFLLISRALEVLGFRDANLWGVLLSRCDAASPRLLENSHLHFEVLDLADPGDKVLH